MYKHDPSAGQTPKPQEQNLHINDYPLNQTIVTIAGQPYGFRKINIARYGWYTVFNPHPYNALVDNTIFLYTSLDPQKPNLPIYPNEKAVVYFEKDAEYYIATPVSGLRVTFVYHGIHKPDYHYFPPSVANALIPAPLPQRFMGFGERPFFIGVPVRDRFMGFGERPGFEYIPEPERDRYMGFGERPGFIPIPQQERYMGFGERPYIDLNPN